jgi:hypothetical protein
MSYRGHFISFAGKVKSVVKKESGDQEKQKIPSTFRERMLFVIWLAGKVLGTDNSQQFARALRKGASQLSKWVNENPRPEWESIKKIADTVRVDPMWLDDPIRPGAHVPPDFEEWLTARRERQAAEAKPRRSAK